MSDFISSRPWTVPVQGHTHALICIKNDIRMEKCFCLWHVGCWIGLIIGFAWNSMRASHVVITHTLPANSCAKWWGTYILQNIFCANAFAKLMKICSGWYWTIMLIMCWHHKIMHIEHTIYEKYSTGWAVSVSSSLQYVTYFSNYCRKLIICEHLIHYATFLWSDMLICLLMYNNCVWHLISW